MNGSTRNGMPHRDQAIRALVQAGAGRALEDLKRVIALPTPNPPGAETEVARYLATQCELHGAITRLVDAHPGRANVIAEWRFGAAVDTPNDGTTPTLILTSHTDVVPAPENLWRPWVENGRLYGRGSCDAKGPLIAMMAACQAIAELERSGLPLDGRLIFAGCVNEESGGTGTDHFAAQYVADNPNANTVAIVGEPSHLDIARGHRGAYRRHFAFAGRAAHSSTPNAGVNAIYRGARFAFGIEALHQRLTSPPSADAGAAAHAIYAEHGAAAASLNVIQGGAKLNVIPDRCEVQVERRLRPGETLDDAEAEIQAILAAMRATDPDVAVEVIPMPGDKNPAVLPLDHPLLALVGDCVEATIGRRPDNEIMVGGTDMVFLSQRGIPTLVYGPGDGSMAHKVDEYIEIAQIAKATEVYVRLATKLLG